MGRILGGIKRLVPLQIRQPPNSGANPSAIQAYYAPNIPPVLPRNHHSAPDNRQTLAPFPVAHSPVRHLHQRFTLGTPTATIYIALGSAITSRRPLQE